MKSAHRNIQVSLGERSYPIYVGSDILGDPELLSGIVDGRQVLVVSNDIVAPLYTDTLAVALKHARASSAVVLPDGEQHKTLDTTKILFDKLLENGFNRDCCLIALGGGVIGDITGFVAATYQRGVDFIQIPTTLLAQVDASVGGKTAVNHPLGKNMIGAFHQPRAVVADIATLTTLPEREYLAGLSEVIKYGLLGDAKFFAWIENNLAALLAQQGEVVAEAVTRSCQNKARIVAEDETEQSGRRALLNLGHSFGHAIETHMGYGEWLHGEAVATGMCMAASLSCRLGWLNEADRDRSIAVIAAAGLPVTAPAGITPQDFVKNMALDKKVAAGQLRLVLMHAIGKAIQTCDYDENALQATLDEYCSNAR